MVLTEKPPKLNDLVANAGGCNSREEQNLKMSLGISALAPKWRWVLTILLAITVVAILAAVWWQYRYYALVLEQLQFKLDALAIISLQAKELPAATLESIVWGQIILNANHAVDLLRRLYPRLGGDGALQEKLGWLYFPTGELSAGLEAYYQKAFELETALFPSNRTATRSSAVWALKQYFEKRN